MKNLENVLTKYYSIFITSVKSNLTYVKETLYGTTFMLVIMYIFINLWEVAFASKSTSLSMDFAQTVWYLLIAEAIVLSLNPVYITIGEEVQSGSLAYTINRPYNYLAYHFFNGLGESLLRFIINLFSGAILVLILVGPIHVEFLSLAPVGIIIFLAFLLNYCLSALIGFSAFFTEDTSGIAFIYQKFLFILGGVLIPLDFFPGFMKQITNYLPFAFITFAPSKLFIDFSLLNFYHTLSGQVLWIVLFMLILNIVFTVGKRKLTINGG